VSGAHRVLGRLASAANYLNAGLALAGSNIFGKSAE
jgi:hypothetical protein